MTYAEYKAKLQTPLPENLKLPYVQTPTKSCIMFNYFIFNKIVFGEDSLKQGQLKADFKCYLGHLIGTI